MFAPYAVGELTEIAWHLNKHVQVLLSSISITNARGQLKVKRRSCFSVFVSAYKHFPCGSESAVVHKAVYLVHLYVLEVSLELQGQFNTCLERQCRPLHGNWLGANQLLIMSLHQAVYGELFETGLHQACTLPLSCTCYPVTRSSIKQGKLNHTFLSLNICNASKQSQSF